MRFAAIILAAGLAGCSGNSGGGGGGGIPAPGVGQWVCSHCTGMTLNGNGSFNFPNSSGAVGYIYTVVSGNPLGKTITLTYTVQGPGAVVPSPASGSGSAEVRLFLWRKGDDLQCTTTTEWYRQWPNPGGAGPLTTGQHTISAVISDPGWTDCYGKTDAAQLAGVASNLLGVGFTFGAEFFGHGVFSTGQNSFTVNSFTVQ